MEGSEQPQPIPAGWYPDPAGSGLRWWDGGGWTEHTLTEQAAAAAGAEQHPAAAAPAGAADPEAAGGAGAAGAAPAGGPHAAGTEATAAAASGPEGAAGASEAQVAAGGGTAAAARGEEEVSRGEWALSVLLPLLPLAGLIWGVYLRRRGPRSETAGNVAVVLSLVVILAAVLLLL